jgi:zinc transport system substrate-binding protein
MRFFFSLLLLHCLLAYPQAVYAKADGKVTRVLVDIAPIHHLVTPLLKDIAEPELLITGTQSPHLFQLKPSQAKAIEDADIIIMVGGDMSPDINRAIKRLNKKHQRIALLSLKVNNYLPYREHDAHENDHHGHHQHNGTDPHIWLDPELMQSVMRALTGELKLRFPNHADQLDRNLETVIASLDEVTTEVNAILAPLKGSKHPIYASYHDAYQYFEKRFALPASPMLLARPEDIAGAKATIHALERVKEDRPHCILSESSTPLVTRAEETSGAKIIALDPEYGLLDHPAATYRQLLTDIAIAISRCAAD